MLKAPLLFRYAQKQIIEHTIATITRSKSIPPITAPVTTEVGCGLETGLLHSGSSIELIITWHEPSTEMKTNSNAIRAPCISHSIMKAATSVGIAVGVFDSIARKVTAFSDSAKQRNFGSVM